MGCIIRFIKLFIKLSIILLIVVFINGFFIYKNAIKSVPLTQKVSDIRGKENYVISSNVSDYFKEFIVSIEDKRFYHHKGIDPVVLIRSFLDNLSAGYYKYGGSTITQQLAKNMYFSSEKKISRKIAEMLVSFDLERNYSKDEILEMYINIIYFGNGYYGIKDASYGYFNIPPSDLNAYDSSLLVGIPQAPSVYNLKNKNRAMTKRYNVILNSLVKNGNISKDEGKKFKQMYIGF